MGGGLTLLLIKVDANLSVSGAASKPSSHPHHLSTYFLTPFCLFLLDWKNNTNF
jgi:hypothetical protein